MDALRKQLVDLLTGENAHVNFEGAVRDVPGEVRGARPKGAEHSPWELLEHLRIAQWDILEFSRNPGHVSPDFPNGYWPKQAAPPDDGSWDRSVAEFERDLKEMAALISNPSRDLLARIPHGDGQTLLRQALLLADHNAYHIGQLVLVRRMLHAWR